MTLRQLFAAGSMLSLAACTGGANGPELQPISAPPATPAAKPVGGLNGKSEAEITRLFGAPVQENVEGSGKRLQFARGGCVLDAYLYPLRPNGQLVVAHVDTRKVTGEDLDQPSCLRAFGVKP